MSDIKDMLKKTFNIKLDEEPQEKNAEFDDVVSQAQAFLKKADSMISSEGPEKLSSRLTEEEHFILKLATKL